MKRLSMIMMCLFVMMAASTSLKAQQVTIPLMPGWTWISYPSTDTLDFATALGSFTPAVGDIIESQFGFLNTMTANGLEKSNSFTLGMATCTIRIAICLLF